MLWQVMVCSDTHAMKVPPPIFAFALFLSVAAPSAQAAVQFVGGTYFQNFDSLNGLTAWADNSTLDGWYARTTATASISTLGSNTGSTNAAGLYSYGVSGTNAVTERSLGFTTSNTFTGSVGTAFNYIGFNLTNASGKNLTTITIGYDGEQWRQEGNENSHSMTVEYSFDATSLSSGSWTNAGSSLTFTSPRTGTSAGALDGNASSNSIRSLTGTISSINWLPATNLWIRFVDLNDSGNDHHLTIDNFSFTAIPEPAAALLGSLGLLVLLRRRR
jgi:hypothetical protein